MWDDDLALRAEVLAELDTAPPAEGDGLTEVVRRGRWRRRARYTGAGLGVVALLTVTGMVATALAGEPLPPAQHPVAKDAAWPRADLPAQVPYGVWAANETAPPTAPADRLYQLCSMPEALHDRVDADPAPAALLDDLSAATRAAAPDARLGGVRGQHLEPTRPGTRDAWSYEVDVTDAGGTGSVRLGVGDFRDTPLAAADAQAFDVGNCAPPKRRVLADGTVLQLYEVRPSEPYQSLTQVLRIFRPDGVLYQVVAQSWGSRDFAPNPAQPRFPHRTGQGRPTLPLTEAQLAEIGLGIAG